MFGKRDRKLSVQYIIKNILQQRKEIVVFTSQIRVWEMACYLWWCGWHDCMGDTCILGVALFLKLFLKPTRKRIQLYFSEFPLDIWIMSLQSCFQNRFKTLAYSGPEVYEEPCQYTPWNSSILRFLIHSKSWYIESLRHIQNTVNL